MVLSIAQAGLELLIFLPLSLSAAWSCSLLSATKVILEKIIMILEKRFETSKYSEYCKLLQFQFPYKFGSGLGKLLWFSLRWEKCGSSACDF